MFYYVHLSCLLLDKKEENQALLEFEFFVFVHIYSIVTGVQMPHLYRLGLNPGTATYELCNFGQVT